MRGACSQEAKLQSSQEEWKEEEEKKLEREGKNLNLEKLNLTWMLTRGSYDNFVHDVVVWFEVKQKEVARNRRREYYVYVFYSLQVYVYGFRWIFFYYELTWDFPLRRTNSYTIHYLDIQFCCLLLFTLYLSFFFHVAWFVTGRLKSKVFGIFPWGNILVTLFECINWFSFFRSLLPTWKETGKMHWWKLNIRNETRERERHHPCNTSFWVCMNHKDG